MNDQRWRQIETLYHAALEHEPGAREAFLAKACADDEELRREVEELLSHDGAVESFIKGNALAVAAQELEGEDLNTTKALAGAGQQIGAYKILAPLGRGGMGEVHLALDTRLGRKVAVKLLPDRFTHELERVRRFEQEARAASALNHPNIITVHDIGEIEGKRYIVEEYVDGDTLRQRMTSAAQQQMKPSEAIEVATQIAAALSAAHEAGIIHRDIKPENVMVRRDGLVKVLDFGLAKLTEPSAPVVDTKAPTMVRGGTESGVVMGTPRYMSPEQARGEKVDMRTDLFSLGVMLYEMVAGCAPFTGATTSEVIASILRDEQASLSLHAPEAPHQLERIVSRALRKERKERYQTAKELLSDLKDIKQELEIQARQERSVSAPSVSAIRRAKAPVLLLISALLIVVAGLAYFSLRSPALPRVSELRQVTKNGRKKAGSTIFYRQLQLVTDGSRLYFSEFAGGRYVLAQVSSAGGEAAMIQTPFPNTHVLDLSPNRSEILVASRIQQEIECPLWIVSVLGGSPRRLGEVLGHSAAWSPDGQQVVFANGPNLYLVRKDGAEPRKLVTVDGFPISLRWSPDGSRLRFSVGRGAVTRSLWEVTADGSNLHPLLPGWNNPSDECCGNWTSDGKYYVFQSTRDQSTQIWALREPDGLFSGPRYDPVQLTFGPINFRHPVPSVDGGKIFAVGEIRRGELVRYDSKAQQFVPYLSELSAEQLDFSKDGEWVTYVTYPEGELWRSRVDGTDRLQLSFAPMQAVVPRWSPDGKRIAFSGRLPGKKFKVYLISSEGGTAQQLMPEDRIEEDPNWSPDGNILVFAVRVIANSPTIHLHLLDLRTDQVSLLPGSEGLFGPRWSPEGRYISAVSTDAQKLLLFDITSRQWTELAKMNNAWSHWSRDGKYIYFSSLFQKDPALFRLRVEDRKVELLASLKDIRLGAGFYGVWTGLTADDSPLVLRDVGTQDIYALEWKAP